MWPWLPTLATCLRSTFRPVRRQPRNGGSSVGVVSVLVSFADVRRQVDTVAALDEVLDGLAAGDQPVLVELVSGAATLNIGVGLDHAAVLLFRDAGGRPWVARSHEGPPVVTDADLEFAKNATRYRFFAHAAVHRSEMREAATQFVALPGSRPSAVAWLPEGVDDDNFGGAVNGP